MKFRIILLAIIGTSFACNATSKKNSRDEVSESADDSSRNVGWTELLRVKDIAAGDERCLGAGGVAIEVGPDRNNNFKLDDDEVEIYRTKNVCNGRYVSVYQGDFVVSDLGTYALAATFTGITGSLTVAPHIDYVRIDFPLLETVGKDFVVTEADLAESINAPKLTYVAERLHITNCQNLRELNFPRLMRGPAEMTIKDNQNLSVCITRNLEHQIDNNPAGDIRTGNKNPCEPNPCRTSRGVLLQCVPRCDDSVAAAGIDHSCW